MLLLALARGCMLGIPSVGDLQTISGAGLPKAAHVMEIRLPPYSKEPFGCDTRTAGSRAVVVKSNHVFILQV